MSLSKSIDDREYTKFKECNGETAVNTTICQESGETLNVTSNPAAIPKIYNLSAPVADTEVSQVLSANVKQLLIKVRGNAKMQIAFVSTESGTKFMTVPNGSVLSLEDLKLSSTTLYLQTNKASQIIEILEWT